MLSLSAADNADRYDCRQTAIIRLDRAPLVLTILMFFYSELSSPPVVNGLMRQRSSSVHLCREIPILFIFLLRGINQTS